MAAQLHIRVLGTFEVTDDAGDLCKLSTQKHRALLAYLAVNKGQNISREHAANLLWGDRSEPQARRSLAQALHDIRRLAPSNSELILDRDGRLSVSSDAVTLDLDQFSTLVTETDVTSLEGAVQLYGGELLQGLEINEEAFQDWLLVVREKANAKAIDAYMRLVRGYAEVDRLVEAIGAARNGLLIDPFNERLHQSVIEYLAALGRTAEAIRHYQKMKDELRRELDIAPSAEVSAIIREITSHRSDFQTSILVSPHRAKTDELGLPRSAPVLGVLPFELVGTDRSLAYMATGMADEIATELGRFHSLTVLSRDSVFQCDDATLPASETLQILGATHLVRGGLQFRGNKLRISVQLVELGTARLIWSERYDVAREVLFDVQDDIVAQTVSTLFGRLIDDRTAGARNRPTQSLSAYDCVLKGMAIHKSGHTTHEEAKQAVAWFDQALQIDPQYARAHAWRACSASHLWPGQPNQDHLDINMRSVETALSIDPTDSEAHRIKGALHTFQRDFEPALYHLRRARTLNPNDAQLLIKGGLYQSLLGERDDAIADVEHSMRRNPLHPDWYWRDKGIVLFTIGATAEALASLKLITERREVDLVYQTACLVELGNVKAARIRLEELRRQYPDFDLIRLETSIPFRCYRRSKVAQHLKDLLVTAGLD